MGYLGFVFDLTYLEDKSLLLKEIELDKDFLIIFIEKKDLKKNHIISFQSKFDKENSNLVFMDQDLNFKNFVLLEETNYRFGKISLNSNQVVDFEDNTFWFSIERYKEIHRLLIINDLNFILKDRMFLLMNFFV